MTVFPRPGRCPLLVLLAALPAAAIAQTTAPLMTITVLGDAEGYQAAPSSTALRADTPANPVPQSLTVIARALIDDQGMQSLADVLRNVPGAGMAQGEGNRETPVLRGSTAAGDFLLDGLRDDVPYYRDLYNIEQVEVLTGANGLLFGRGGVGGVINRVSKRAGQRVQQVTLQGSIQDQRRATLDLGDALSETFAARLSALAEDSGSYRDGVTLRRQGITPVIAQLWGDHTLLTAGIEYFNDERVADRGVSAFNGRPIDTAPSLFIGDPARSPARSTVRALSASLEHVASPSLTLRNRTRLADYDKFYQNVFAGAVDASGTRVAISAYNNATQRQNLLNQTDLTYTTTDTWGIGHAVLAGLELGQQATENRRLTGYFTDVSPTTTTVSVPLTHPRTTAALAFRPSATDASNQGTARFAALFAQDQLQFTPQLAALLGLRLEHFSVDFLNRRSNTRIRTQDALLSPRAGLVYTPAEDLSVYGSYSRSFQPRAGEQLSSLTVGNAALAPERFTNHEVGVKWTVRQGLGLTAAAYRLDRQNVAIADPVDSTRLVLVAGQQVQGVELGATGSMTDRWSLVAAYAWQQGHIASDQSPAVRAGAQLAALPRHSGSLWNRYDVAPDVGVGLGLSYRGELLAATQNRLVPAADVHLPAYLRLDAALFYDLSRRLRVQANVENLLDGRYFVSAHSNTNITPGSPRALRLTLQAQF